MGDGVVWLAFLSKNGFSNSNTSNTHPPLVKTKPPPQHWAGYITDCHPRWFWPAARGILLHPLMHDFILFHPQCLRWRWIWTRRRTVRRASSRLPIFREIITTTWTTGSLSSGRKTRALSYSFTRSTSRSRKIAFTTIWKFTTPPLMAEGSH